MTGFPCIGSDTWRELDIEEGERICGDILVKFVIAPNIEAANLRLFDEMTSEELFRKIRGLLNRDANPDFPLLLKKISPFNVKIDAAPIFSYCAWPKFAGTWMWVQSTKPSLGPSGLVSAANSSIE